eukprot:364971-Chlamydomonas_euryale.AAC.8
MLVWRDGKSTIWRTLLPARGAHRAVVRAQQAVELVERATEGRRQAAVKRGAAGGAARHVFAWRGGGVHRQRWRSWRCPPAATAASTTAKGLAVAEAASAAAAKAALAAVVKAAPAAIAKAASATAMAVAKAASATAIAEAASATAAAAVAKAALVTASAAIAKAASAAASVTAAVVAILLRGVAGAVLTAVASSTVVSAIKQLEPAQHRGKLGRACPAIRKKCMCRLGHVQSQHSQPARPHGRRRRERAPAVGARVLDAAAYARVLNAAE